jgi:oligosaccharyltransferase complex subunit alpha (ribophorin I)
VLISCSNVKLLADIPESSITEYTVGLHKTYLDTIGRTAVHIKARNLVDEFRDRELLITYDTSLSVTLRKPLMVFASMLAVYVFAWAVGNIDVGFSKTKQA